MRQEANVAFATANGCPSGATMSRDSGRGRVQSGLAEFGSDVDRAAFSDAVCIYSEIMATSLSPRLLAYRLLSCRSILPWRNRVAGWFGDKADVATKRFKAFGRDAVGSVYGL